MSSINGFGSTYIGCSDIGRDGSYVITEWMIILIPIVPLRSFRVLPTSHTNLGFYSSSKFQAQRVPLYWPHVLVNLFFCAILWDRPAAKPSEIKAQSGLLQPVPHNICGELRAQNP